MNEVATYLLSSEDAGGGVGDADGTVISDFPNALNFAAIAAAALTFSSSEIAAGGAAVGGEGTAGGANGLYARGGGEGEAIAAGGGLLPIVDIAIRRR